MYVGADASPAPRTTGRKRFLLRFVAEMEVTECSARAVYWIDRKIVSRFRGGSAGLAVTRGSSSKLVGGVHRAEERGCLDVRDGGDGDAGSGGVGQNNASTSGRLTKSVKCESAG